MSFAYDDSDWPIVAVKASGDSTDEDLSGYVASLSEALARRQRHVVIVDATEGKNLRSTHRKMVADWNKANAEALSLYRAGLALVTPSPVLRGLITAVYWLFPAPFPYKAFDSLPEAWVWAHRQLELPGFSQKDRRSSTGRSSRW